MHKSSISEKNLSKVALENSSYNLILNLILKIGGLIFTILIARILLPELFGIYSLALSIVTIFISFTDIGIDNTFLRYFSEALASENKKKARGYFRYLSSIKFILIFISVLFILIFSKFIAYNIYNKPLLHFALIFSCLFIIMESLTTFFGNVLIARKNLKPLPLLTLINQLMKILLSLLAISLVVNEFKVPLMFLAFAISGGIYLFLTLLIIYKEDKDFIVGPKKKIDKKQVNNYLKFVAISSLSLAFFSSIDIIMLGKFVEAAYLGYYRVALSLILTIASLFSISSVFLPIFTQIKNERFKRGFNKTLRYIFMLSIPAAVGIIFIGKYLIKAIYGDSYLLAASPMYFLSLLVLTTPLIGLYSIIFQSKEKPKIVSNALLISLGANIILNVFIIFLFKNNPLFMISGVGLSNSLSRIFLLGILIFHSKKEFNLEINKIGLKKYLFSTLVMSAFLLTFNYFIDINLILGLVEIILGVAIYLGCLVLFKGITKEDFKLFSSLFKKR